MDRVGGGDSFASGLIYGLMTTGDAELAVNYGAAHGALAMTTPGDTTMADGKIVSTYVGTQAFAAVGATAVIANLIIGFVNGVTQGFGIPISRCFGAGDYKNMRRYVAGSFIMTALQ